MRGRDKDDLVLAEDLARRAAMAVDNARLFQSSQQLARTLQESLLPQALPHIPGIRIVGRYRAAAKGQDVGGDFYDAFAIGENSWGIVIGDVCGKGAQAAALTALARYTIRALADRDPATVLGRLNDAVTRDQEFVRDRFLTALMIIATIDSGQLRLELAAAGHPAPLVLRADATVERLAVSGPLIGVTSGVTYLPGHAVLSPGDTMLLYTDGLTDARAPVRILSESDLGEILLAAHGMGGRADGVVHRGASHGRGRPPRRHCTPGDRTRTGVRRPRSSRGVPGCGSLGLALGVQRRAELVALCVVELRGLHVLRVVGLKLLTIPGDVVRATFLVRTLRRVGNGLGVSSGVSLWVGHGASPIGCSAVRILQDPVAVSYPRRGPRNLDLRTFDLTAVLGRLRATTGRCTRFPGCSSRL
jgi:hypothetical protein